MPNKPTKYGIKAFTLASSEHGYLLNILLYTGADTLSEANQDHAHLPQPARVVTHILQPYLNRGHHIYTDRYYSSLPLAEVLLERGTSFTGTMIKNRVRLPETIIIIPSTSFRLANDEVRAYRSDHLLTVAWHAATKKKPLIILSSSSEQQMVAVRSRRSTQMKPIVVDRYNHCMKFWMEHDQYLEEQ